MTEKLYLKRQNLKENNDPLSPKNHQAYLMKMMKQHEEHYNIHANALKNKLKDVGTIEHSRAADHLEDISIHANEMHRSHREHESLRNNLEHLQARHPDLL